MDGGVVEVGSFDELVSKVNGHFRQLIQHQLVVDDL
jgi:ABC-type multidrug transport system fused ATPase/permease subunit